MGADLAALETAELNAFKDYLAKVKDAGVKLNITSTAADKLKLSYRIKYNALVLNASGGRIDGTVATPVKDAIKQHLKNLPFNGIFSVTSLVDAIQNVEGVQDVKIDVVQTKYGALPFSSVDIDYIPDSGYLRIDDVDLTENILTLLMNKKVYYIDFDKLVNWLVPAYIRKQIITNWLIVLVGPVVTVYQNFIRFRNQKLYDLSITPQVCFLQKLLNDRYDFTLRRIIIVDGIDKPPTYIFLDAELKPLYFKESF
jgi:hypothetical protein